MEKKEKELLELYRDMIPANKANMLAYARVAKAAQENTKKALGISAKPEKNRETA
jgi:hypothetical protein